MKTLKELRDELGVKRDALDAQQNAIQAEKRNATPDENTALDSLLAEIVALKGDITRAEALDAEKQSRALAGAPVGGNVSQNEARDLRKFSLLRGLQLMAQKKELDGLEAEVHAEAVKDARHNGVEIEGFGVPAFLGEKRDQTVTLQTTNPGDQGGVTVETEVAGLIEALWQKSFLGKVNARRIAGLRGNQDFIVQDTVPTIQELTEIEQMNDSQILFSKFTMQPNRRGTSIPISKQLLLQSSFDVQALVQDNIRKALDYKLNAEAIVKLLSVITSGNGNLLALGTNGVAPTYADMVTLEAMVESSEIDSDSMAYLINTPTKAKLKNTQVFASTNGTAVYGSDNTINGHRAVTSNIVPKNLTKGTSSGVASAVIFGDFSELYVGIWGGVDFVVDIYTLAKKGEVAITANMFWDVEVARAKAFAGIKDALTA